MKYIRLNTSHSRQSVPAFSYVITDSPEASLVIRSPKYRIKLYRFRHIFDNEENITQVQDHAVTVLLYHLAVFIYYFFIRYYKALFFMFETQNLSSIFLFLNYFCFMNPRDWFRESVILKTAERWQSIL